MPQIVISHISGKNPDLVAAPQKSLHHIIKNAFPAANIRIEVGKYKTDFHSQTTFNSMPNNI